MQEMISLVLKLRSGLSGRSSNNRGTELGLCFCCVLFTFNKYSELLASVVICIDGTVGLWRLNCEQCLW
jgi:hypothetical protein